MSYKPLSQQEIEEEEILLTELARLKAESDAYYQAMEEEYFKELVERETEWRNDQIC